MSVPEAEGETFCYVAPENLQSLKVQTGMTQSRTKKWGRMALEVWHSAEKFCPQYHFKGVYRAAVSNLTWRAAVLLDGRETSMLVLEAWKQK